MFGQQRAVEFHIFHAGGRDLIVNDIASPDIKTARQKKEQKAHAEKPFIHVSGVFNKPRCDWRLLRQLGDSRYGWFDLRFFERNGYGWAFFIRLGLRFASLDNLVCQPIEEFDEIERAACGV